MKGSRPGPGAPAGTPSRAESRIECPELTDKAINQPKIIWKIIPKLLKWWNLEVLVPSIIKPRFYETKTDPNNFPALLNLLFKHIFHKNNKQKQKKLAKNTFVYLFPLCLIIPNQLLVCCRMVFDGIVHDVQKVKKRVVTLVSLDAKAKERKAAAEREAALAIKEAREKAEQDGQDPDKAAAEATEEFKRQVQ